MSGLTEQLHFHAHAKRHSDVAAGRTPSGFPHRLTPNF